MMSQPDPSSIALEECDAVDDTHLSPSAPDPKCLSPRRSLPNPIDPFEPSCLLFEPRPFQGELSVLRERSSQSLPVHVEGLGEEPLPPVEPACYTHRRSLPGSPYKNRAETLPKLNCRISQPVLHAAPNTRQPSKERQRRASTDHFVGIHVQGRSQGAQRAPGGRISPAQQRSSSVERGVLGVGSLVGNLIRPKDRFIPLRYDQGAYHIAEGDEVTETEDDSEMDVLGADDLVLASVAKRGRITVFCVADAFSRESLDRTMQKLYPSSTYKMYPEVVYLQTPYAARGPRGDVFIFDYGVVACWGLTPDQEQGLLKQLQVSAEDNPVAADDEVQTDNFSFHYSNTKHPHIQNETITIDKMHAQDHLVKLSVTHALAQSSKLTVYENRIVGLVEEVRYLPEALAEHGEIHMERRQLAKLMGKVFLQKSAVNLLSTVLDTPEFFWRMKDSFKAVYDSVGEYLELQERVELLNGKFVVIQKLLKISCSHSYHHYISRLEVVVMWLVLIEVVLSAFEVAGFFYY